MSMGFSFLSKHHEVLMQSLNKQIIHSQTPFLLSLPHGSNIPAVYLQHLILYMHIYMCFVWVHLDAQMHLTSLVLCAMILIAKKQSPGEKEEKDKKTGLFEYCAIIIRRLNLTCWFSFCGNSLVHKTHFLHHVETDFSISSGVFS